MATYKPGPLVSAIAGSVGGVTFQRQAGAPQVRAKAKPLLRRSRYTTKMRSGLYTVSRTWGTLDESTRADWTALAAGLTWTNRFGDPFTPTGYQLFTRLNNMRVYLEQPVYPSAPALITVPPIGAADIYWNSTTELLVAYPALSEVPDEYVLLVELTPKLSQAITNPGNRYRFIAQIAKGTSSPQDITAAWQARFSANMDSKLCTFGRMRLVHVATGWAGPWQTYKSIAP